MVARALNPAFESQRQEDFCEFKASLVYRVSARTVRAMKKIIKLKTNYNMYNEEMER